MIQYRGHFGAFERPGLCYPPLPCPIRRSSCPIIWLPCLIFMGDHLKESPSPYPSICSYPFVTQHKSSRPTTTFLPIRGRKRKTHKKIRLSMIYMYSHNHSSEDIQWGGWVGNSWSTHLLILFMTVLEQNYFLMICRSCRPVHVPPVLFSIIMLHVIRIPNPLPILMTFLI